MADHDENSTSLTKKTTPTLSVATKTKTSKTSKSWPSPKPPTRRTSLDWRRHYSRPNSLTAQKPVTPKRMTSLGWRNSINADSTALKVEKSLPAESTALQVGKALPAESDVADNSALAELQKNTPNTDRLEPPISVRTNVDGLVVSHQNPPSNGETIVPTNINASDSTPDDWELANFDDLKLASGSDSDAAGSETLKDEEKRIRTRLESFATECFQSGAASVSSTTPKQKKIIFENIESGDMRKLVRSQLHRYICILRYMFVYEHQRKHKHMHA